MAIFLSTYINKLDKKGRVSVPSSFRAALAGQVFQGIIVFRSYRFPAIEAGGVDLMERLVKSADRLEMFSDARHDVSATIFADSEQAAFDSEGRILLSEMMRAHAQIGEKVAFVGSGSTFQIWEPEAFQAHQTEARRRLQEKGFSLSLSEHMLGSKDGAS